MGKDSIADTSIIAIYLPISIWYDDDAYSDEAERMIDELLSLSGNIEYPIDEDTQFLFEFVELNESDFKQLNIHQSASNLIPMRYLKISSKFQYKLLDVYDRMTGMETSYHFQMNSCCLLY